MLNLKHFFTIALLLCTAIAHAHDFEVDGLFYSVISDSEVEVTSSPNPDVYTGDVVIPSTVTYSGVTYSVTSIAEEAFANSFGLISIEIPGSVISIGDNAFYPHSPNVKSITVSNDNPVYDSRDNCNAIIETSTNTLIRGCANSTIPNGVTTIDKRAFAGCNDGFSVEIPGSVTSIGEEAFSSCNLSLVKISASVTEIGKWAFSGSVGLSIIVDADNPVYDSRDNCNAIIETSTNTLITGCSNTIIPDGITAIESKAFGLHSPRIIKIPASVTSIGARAFYYGYIEEIYCLSKMPAECGSECFLEVVTETCVLHVPAGCADAYKAANGWGAFVNIVDDQPIRSFEVDGLVYNVISDTEVEVAPKSDYAGDVVIPSTVTDSETVYRVIKIGDGAFSRCFALSSIKIPDSVISIGKMAFEACHGLISIEIPNSVTLICDGTFSYCTGLTSIAIPSSVTSIGKRAFSECHSLISIEIPSSVTSIGEAAFLNCSGLTSIEIPGSVTSIGDYAFDGCPGPTSIEIPGSVTSIGYGAFSCPNVMSIIVSVDNPIYDSRDNCNAIIETSTNTLITGCCNTIIPDSVTSIGEAAFLHCSGLTSIDIPDSVTSIGDYAFDYCTGLTSIDIPGSVTSIGKSAFDYCTGLTSVEIPNSVTSIGVLAFYECTGLTSIEIPGSVTAIGDWAFYDCTALEQVFCWGQIPAKCGRDSFTPSATCVLHVMAGSVDAYKEADGWKEFRNIVGDLAGIEDVEMAEGATVEYYDLRGVKVSTPTSGIFIKKQGTSVSKIKL